MVPPTPQPGRPRPIDPHRIRDNHDPPARLAACHSIVPTDGIGCKLTGSPLLPTRSRRPVVVRLSHESSMNGEVLAVGAVSAAYELRT